MDAPTPIDMGTAHSINVLSRKFALLPSLIADVFANSILLMVCDVHDAFKRPFLKNIRSDRLDQPAYNTIEGNTYCKCGMFIDASQKDIDGWGSKADNNVEVETC